MSYRGLLHVCLLWGVAGAGCPEGQDDCPSSRTAQSLLQRSKAASGSIAHAEEGDGVVTLASVKELLPQLLSGNSTSLLESVQSLAKQKVTPEVAAFANQTIPLIDELLANVRAAHDSDLQLLRTVFAGFAHILGDVETVDDLSTQVAGARNDLTACRNLESALYVENRNAGETVQEALLRAAAAKEAMIAAAEAMIAADEFDAATGHTRANIHALKVHAEDLYEKTGAYLQSLGFGDPSSNTSTYYNETKAKCDANQSSLEHVACSYATALVSACAQHGSLYNVKRSDYEAVVESTRPKEADRRQEFSALTRIRCVLVFLATDQHGAVADASQQIQQCFADNVDTGFLVIPFNSTPAELDCPAVPAVPCSQEWLTQEYSNMPPNTQADECEPCPTNFTR